MTWNEWENYISRNELDPSIVRRVDIQEYKYLNKKELWYFVLSQLESDKNNIIAEQWFDNSINWTINWFNKIQEDFELNRHRNDEDIKEFIYKIPAPDIWTIKNIIKKYNYKNKNNLNSTLEIELFNNYIFKDIYNLDSQIYLFNIFKKNWLFKRFNEVLPNEVDWILNKSSEEKLELVDKIKKYIEKQKNEIWELWVEEFDKVKLVLQFHDEIDGDFDDELFDEIEKNEENLEEEKVEEQENNIDLSKIDEMVELQEKEQLKFATENEKEVVKEWQEKYPDWCEENLYKIEFNEDWPIFNIEWLKWKTWMRENLKVEKPNEVDVFSIPDGEFKDEQLFTRDAAIRESKKQWLNLPGQYQQEWLVNFMPWENESERHINLMEILNIQLSGYRHTNGYFYSQGSYGYYWSSTSDGSTDARYQYFNSTNENTSNGNKDSGLSVRCLKD